MSEIGLGLLVPGGVEAAELPVLPRVGQQVVVRVAVVQHDDGVDDVVRDADRSGRAVEVRAHRAGVGREADRLPAIRNPVAVGVDPRADRVGALAESVDLVGSLLLLDRLGDRGSGEGERRLGVLGNLEGLDDERGGELLHDEVEGRVRFGRNEEVHRDFGLGRIRIGLVGDRSGVGVRGALGVEDAVALRIVERLDGLAALHDVHAHGAAMHEVGVHEGGEDAARAVAGRDAGGDRLGLHDLAVVLDAAGDRVDAAGGVLVHLLEGAGDALGGEHARARTLGDRVAVLAAGQVEEAEAVLELRLARVVVVLRRGLAVADGHRDDAVEHLDVLVAVDVLEDEADAGVAVINEGKYGVGLEGDEVSLSLLRATIRPDITSDIGHHNFAYAIYPHEGDFLKAEINKKAFEYNIPLRKADAESL